MVFIMYIDNLGLSAITTYLLVEGTHCNLGTWKTKWDNGLMTVYNYSNLYIKQDIVENAYHWMHGIV